MNTTNTLTQEQRETLARWFDDNGYDNADEWAADSDYTKIDAGWVDENGYVVDAELQAWYALEESGDLPGLLPVEDRTYVLAFKMKVRQPANLDSPRGVAKGIEEGLPDEWFDEDDGDGWWIDRIQFSSELITSAVADMPELTKADAVQLVRALTERFGLDDDQVIRVVWTEDDAVNIAVDHDVPLDEAIERAHEWGRHIADTASALCAEQLESAITIGRV